MLVSRRAGRLVVRIADHDEDGGRSLLPEQEEKLEAVHLVHRHIDQDQLVRLGHELHGAKGVELHVDAGGAAQGKKTRAHRLRVFPSRGKD